MFLFFKKSKKTVGFRLFVGTLLTAFLFSLPMASAQIVPLSRAYAPPLIKGITINPQNPLQFDFLVDVGTDALRFQSAEEKSLEYQRLIRYFLAALTVPENNLWVNLSPYEKDRMIPADFGKTEMGRDLLSQDYILKQITASMLHPDQDLGKEFWQKVYQQAREKFGTIDIPVNTFNKVWIVPDKASVYEKDNTVLLIESHLKVMLEQDYVALANQRTSAEPFDSAKDVAPKDTNEIGSQVVREVILPAIEKEVNEGKDFAQLRQINNSLILAIWYKIALKESLLGKVYVDRSKIDGVNQDDVADNQKIYAQYLEAFQKGAYNFIKEEVDPLTQEMIPRKYFSGGYTTIIAGSPLSERIKTLSFGPQVAAAFKNKITRVSVKLKEISADGIRSKIRILALAAIAATGLFLVPGVHGAEFSIDNLALITKFGLNDTFESVASKVFEPHNVLEKVTPSQREEILRKAFAIFKKENLPADIKGIGEALGTGAVLRFTETTYSLSIDVSLALSEVVTRQYLEISGEKIPIYYVVPFNNEDFRKAFPGKARTYGQQGIVVNLKENADNLKIFIGSYHPQNPQLALIKDFYSMLLGQVSGRQALNILMEDLMNHEILHALFMPKANVRIKSTAPWLTALLERPNAAIVQEEVWAYLFQMIKSKRPQVELFDLMVKAKTPPQSFARGDITVPAAQIIRWAMLEELGYPSALVEKRIREEEEKRAEPLTAEEANALRSEILGVWERNPEALIADDELALGFVEESPQKINAAARQAFEKLSGRSVPEVPSLDLPPEVSDKMLFLAASSAITVIKPGQVLTEEFLGELAEQYDLSPRNLGRFLTVGEVITQDDLDNVQTLGRLLALSNQLEYGLNRGKMMKDEGELYKTLTDIIWNFGGESTMSTSDIDRLARTVARMKEGSLRMLNIYGVLTDNELNILRTVDKIEVSGLLKALSVEDKKKMVARLAQVVLSYDAVPQRIKIGLMLRLVPIEIINLLSTYFGFPPSLGQRFAFNYNAFPVWLTNAEKKVDELKSKIGPYADFWQIISSYGVDNVDAWVTKAIPVAEKIATRVGGLRNAWYILTRQGLENIDQWVVDFEKKVSEIKYRVGGESNAQAIVIGQGIKGAETWVTKREEAVSPFISILGKRNAWYLAQRKDPKAIAAWMREAEKEVDFVRSRLLKYNVDGESFSWDIVMGKGLSDVKKVKPWMSDYAEEAVDALISRGATPTEAWRKIINSSPSAQASSAIANTGDSDDFTKGGIDLNPINLNLKIKRDGNGVPLPLLQQDIQAIDINGFTPVIIEIIPVPSLPLFLGVNTQQEDRKLSRK